MDTQRLNSLKQTLERVWSNLKVCIYVNFQILSNSLSLSLVFPSGYINTGGYVLFLNMN